MFSRQGIGLFATQMEFCQSAEISGPHPFPWETQGKGFFDEVSRLMESAEALHYSLVCGGEPSLVSNSSSFSMLQFIFMASVGQGFWINQQILQVCWLDSLEGGHRWRKIFCGSPKAARTRLEYLTLTDDKLYCNILLALHHLGFVKFWVFKNSSVIFK